MDFKSGLENSFCAGANPLSVKYEFNMTILFCRRVSFDFRRDDITSIMLDRIGNVTFIFWGAHARRHKYVISACGDGFLYFGRNTW